MQVGRALLPASLLLAVAGCGGGGGRVDDAPPLALVYRGPAGCAGCAEAVAHLLRTQEPPFEIEFVGPGETRDVSAEALADATVYAQPGGNGTVEQGFAHVASSKADVRAFVRSGGHYLGFCMGGYFAGFDPGFDLLPGDSGEFITSPGASVTTDADTLVAVDWGREERTLYFQDGPYFVLDAKAKGVDVLAHYASNGEIAAMVAPFGSGRVGVVGPHPEATADWYAGYGLHDPDGLDADLGHALVSATLR